MKSRPSKLIIRLIDRAAQWLSKTTLIAVIGRVGGNISAVLCIGIALLKIILLDLLACKYLRVAWLD